MTERVRDKANPVNQRILAVYLLTILGTVIWLGAIFLAPYLRSRSSPWQALIYLIFTPVCHQLPSRSFFLFGQPLAVCARCLGIYSGFALGLGIYPFSRGFRRLALPQTRTFLLISLPIVIDTAGNFLRLWTTSPEGRFVLGLLWGIILPFYLITGLAELALPRENGGG